jgi:hypothetical protein
MSLLRLTAQLYIESAQEAATGFYRTWPAAAMLWIIWALLFVAGLGLSPLGIVGGFIMFLIQAWLLGTYLSMTEVGINGMRRMQFDDVQQHAGALSGICMNVMFVFWVPQFILSMFAPMVLIVLVPVASIVFNPVPEMMYMDRREGGLEIATDAVNFMQRNWPEWIFAQALIALPVAGLWYALTGVMDASWVLSVVQFFSPFFGFLTAGGALLMAGPLAVLGLLLAPAIHLTMLFRGQLYKRLRDSNRRKRAWQAKF